VGAAVGLQVYLVAAKSVRATAPRPIEIEPFVEKLAIGVLFADYAPMLEF
jgi:hypothetical protein